MSEPGYPPPPPPEPDRVFDRSVSGLHGPRSNLFLGIRKQLSALEQPPQFRWGVGPWIGFLLVFFVVGGLRFVVQTICIYGTNRAFGLQPAAAFVNPVIQAAFIVLSMVIVTYLVWGMIPNRRYGFAMGAIAGLGYGLFELPSYAGSAPAYHIFMLPIAEMVLAGFLGIEVFALMAKRVAGKNLVDSLKVPLEFFLISWIFITVYWGTDSYSPDYWVAYLLLPLYVFFLRDFLGGHFNFQNFLEPLSDPSPDFSEPPIPPPPPP